MKAMRMTILIAATTTLIAVTATAQTNLPASRSARVDLKAAMQELAALREKVGGERIALTRQLTDLENSLSAARRENDQSRRLADTCNLEISNLKNEMKAQQDEIAYAGNLLDEFARSFESRLHVSEVPAYAQLIAAALQAPQNKDLTMIQKFQRQIALVSAAAQRIDVLIGGLRFDGAAVDPQGIVSKGRFCLVGPVAMFAGAGTLAGLALPQAGSSQTSVRPIDPEWSARIAAFVESGKGIIPLDPTRGDALKALISRGSLWGYFKKGGPIMWPLLAVSLLAFSVIIERLLFLAIERRRRSPKTLGAIFAALERGHVDAAIEAGKNSRDYIARCLIYALHNRGKSLSDALVRATGEEIHRYTRGVSILDTVVTMAPLLGLLGTVTGMIGAFGMLGGAELSAPAAITGGIAEALIATTFGLGIAIVALVPLNYLHTSAEKARHDLEDSATHLELLMKPILEAERVRETNALEAVETKA
jgi:biopolymer transport protein ExbB